jgi:hypothetical protein
MQGPHTTFIKEESSPLFASASLSPPMPPFSASDIDIECAEAFEAFRMDEELDGWWLDSGRISAPPLDASYLLLMITKFKNKLI